jgi:hypothetical protein
MKKIFSFTWKAVVLFLTFFIMPAAIASIIALDITVYMSCVLNPAYAAIMTLVSIFATCACIDHLIEIS